MMTERVSDMRRVVRVVSSFRFEELPRAVPLQPPQLSPRVRRIPKHHE